MKDPLTSVATIGPEVGDKENKNNMLILILISTQKVYFSDNQAINVIMQEKDVITRYEISRVAYAKLSVFQTYKIIVI